MADLRPSPAGGFDISVETLMIGAGAAGMVAALAAQEAGQQVLVIEADSVPFGSTALSAGLIPAAGTQMQRAAGIADDPQIFAADIQRKADDQNDPEFVGALTQGIGPVIGRQYDRPKLCAPLCGVRATGALFHTQGGLATTSAGQMIHMDGTPLPNLFACGGAACGVSGSNDSGYLSGNGLLGTLALGYAAGKGHMACGPAGD